MPMYTLTSFNLFLYFSDPHNLGIRCRLNGETVQDSNTNQLVHKTEGLVSYISQYVTIHYTVLV